MKLFFYNFSSKDPSIFILHCPPPKLCGPSCLCMIGLRLRLPLHFLPNSLLYLTHQPGVLAGQRTPRPQFCHLTCTLLFPLLGTPFPHMSPGSLPLSDIFLNCHLLILTPNDQRLPYSPYESAAPC